MLKFKKGLYKLKGSVKSIKLFAFDIETHANNQKFTLGSIYGENYQKTFYSREEMQQEILKNRIFCNSYIAATNLMFDFFALFPMRENPFSQFKIIERNSSLIFASGYIPKFESKYFYTKSLVQDYKKENKIDCVKHLFEPVTFIDSTAHYKSSVDNLGQIVKTEKLNKPLFLGNEPKNSAEWEILKEYNMKDSEITYKFMDFLQKTYNKIGCNLKVTISASSMDLFRRKYLKKPIYQENRKKIDYMYKGYYGGRVETFKRGLFERENIELKYYDVNSFYSFILQTNKYPIINEGRFKDKVTFEDIENFDGNCYAELKIKDKYIPFLPLKTDKLIFPLGKIKGYYDFYSLRKALIYDYEIIKLGKGLIYENKEFIFKDFITDLYKLRKELKSENNNTDIIPKILMNSFYGKFGYNYKDKEMIIDGSEIHKYYNKKSYSVIPYSSIPELSYFYRVTTTNKSFIPNYTIPIYASYTTAIAREHLYKIFKKCSLEKIYYCDTDSLITDKILETDMDIGGLKKEHTFQKLCLIKPKFYMGIDIEDKYLLKIKGLNKLNIPFNQLLEKIKNNDFKFNNISFRKLRGHFHNHNINEIYSTLKEIDLQDNKRIWNKQFTLKPQNSEPINI